MKIKYFVFIFIHLTINFNIYSENIFRIEVDKKFGFIDSNGKIVVEPTFHDAQLSSINSNLIYVSKNGKCGYIDKNGIIKIALQFYECSRFYEDFAIVIDEFNCIENQLEYSQSVIDKSGNIIFSTKDKTILTYSEGFFVIRNKVQKKCNFNEALQNSNNFGNYGLLNSKGKEIFGLEFQFISGFKNGLSIVKSNGKWGILDKNLKIVLPIKYDNISTFVAGYSIIQLNNESAVLNNKLEIVIPFGIYLSILDFSEEKTRACKYILPRKSSDYQCSNVIIDLKGNILFKETMQLKYIENFYDGVAIATNERKLQGLIDKTFKWVIKPKYYLISPIGDGFFQVYLSESDQLNNRYAIINKDDTVIWKY